MLYSFDEATGALQFSHKIELQTQHMLSILFVIFLITILSPASGAYFKAINCT